ncbi:hypothetical protein HU200_052450 [Digitaria exilis]|uniref:Uncharacterized protein n=1 Tax=Digitaria exilis TaxID=1010633 RepID=A0A835E495_9POAL|nr:hypothetical protein HU200_052450 [Digitaria exilis]
METSVRYLMASSLVILVMISFNSPSCRACIWPWCDPSPPCFQTSDILCNEVACKFVCEVKGVLTDHAYCKPPRRSGQNVYLCCCPPERVFD